jgi:hypothetical protein
MRSINNKQFLAERITHDERAPVHGHRPHYFPDSTSRGLRRRHETLWP